MKENSYRNIFKSTAIFGGVQVFNILINIVRSKFVAVLLGPAGMGINSLLTSTIGVISSLTNFGLSSSAVKNIAAANATNNEQEIAKVVTVFRSWVWITGLLGFIVALVLSPWLSKIAFGNFQYTVAFALISVTLLMNQISAGQGVILRGMRQIKYMAQSGMAGSAIGLLTSIPLYYFFGEKGIVPSIIITAVTGLALTWYFAKKVPVKSISINREILFSEGKEMLYMGFMLSLTGLITTGTTYLLRIFISKNGTLADVGLYNAGFAIINSYVALIFKALSTDYYPRLSAIAHDNAKASEEINQQAEIGVLIISPILCFFLVFINWAVIILYSNKFLAINSMVHWLALGMFFKSCSWAISFLILAKGESKIFFWNEVAANIYLLVLDVLGYYFGGLTGLGISFLISYFLYMVQMIVVTRRLYQFSFNAQFIKMFMLQLSIGISCFMVARLLDGVLFYVLGGALICASAGYSLFEINRKLGLRAMLGKFKRKS